MTDKKVRNTAWGAHRASHDGGSLIDLYETRDDAMRWLVQKHRECMKDAAVTDAFWRKEYTERAAQATDERMRAYYTEKSVNPDAGKVSDITDSGLNGAQFTDDPDTYYIREHTIHAYRTPEAPRV